MPVGADTVPDLGIMRLQILLAARGGCRAELASRLDAEGRKTAALFDRRGHVTVLVQIDDDLFPQANPLGRPYDAVLEVESSAEAGLQSFVDAVEGIGERLGDVVHGDLSAALIGAPQAIIRIDPTPLRYLYLMRRKAGTSREDDLRLLPPSLQLRVPNPRDRRLQPVSRRSGPIRHARPSTRLRYLRHRQRERAVPRFLGGLLGQDRRRQARRRSRR